MKKVHLIPLFLTTGLALSGQTVGTFTSIQPGAQSEVFQFPSSHAVQKLIQVGDPAGGDVGNLPALPDYTCYVPTDGSSSEGQLFLNHEIDQGNGRVSMFDLSFDEDEQLWEMSNASDLDFSGVGGVSRPCSGEIAPWGNVVIGEEDITTADANGDDYRDWGWLIEIDPVSRTVLDKVWAAGNRYYENATFAGDQVTSYSSSDEATAAFIYKFVADDAGDLSSGELFVFKRDGPNSTTGTWIVLPNETPSERNLAGQAAVNAGATNFNKVEGIRIGPDGKIYFASAGTGSIYRFTDNGSTVSNFERWVGPSTTNYTINYGNGSQSVPWGLGNDNIAFDSEGNLWVFQDGDNFYIWVVKPNHTPASPKVELFGISPSGAEPSGITFTPDGNYIFMSFMHAASNNDVQVTDAAGNQFVYNRGTVLVLARAENLGAPLPLQLTWFDARPENSDVILNWEATDAVGFDHFEIERSTDGSTFRTVGSISAQASSFTAQRFLFRDENAGAGCFYYRLKMNDLDGQFAHSPIKSVCLKGDSPRIDVLGNLLVAGESATFQLHHWPARRPIEITVSDAGGVILDRHEYEPCATGICTFDIPFQFRQAGVFNVRFTDGYSTVVKKILVQ